MSTTGEKQVDNLNGATVQKFLNTIWTGVAIFVVEVIVFIILRKKLIRLYEPRTYLVPEK